MIDLHGWCHVMVGFLLRTLIWNPINFINKLWKLIKLELQTWIRETLLGTSEDDEGLGNDEPVFSATHKSPSFLFETAWAQENLNRESCSATAPENFWTTDGDDKSIVTTKRLGHRVSETDRRYCIALPIRTWRKNFSGARRFWLPRVKEWRENSEGRVLLYDRAQSGTQLGLFLSSDFYAFLIFFLCLLSWQLSNFFLYFPHNLNQRPRPLETLEQDKIKYGV